MIEHKHYIREYGEDLPRGSQLQMENSKKG
jgi:hypothetical protein